jgi:hypothetical protein
MRRLGSAGLTEAGLPWGLMLKELCAEDEGLLV